MMTSAESRFTLPPLDFGHYLTKRLLQKLRCLVSVLSYKKVYFEYLTEDLEISTYFQYRLYLPISICTYLCFRQSTNVYGFGFSNFIKANVKLDGFTVDGYRFRWMVLRWMVTGYVEIWT